jgi:hypothetical protein
MGAENARLAPDSRKTSSTADPASFLRIETTRPVARISAKVKKPCISFFEFFISHGLF